MFQTHKIHIRNFPSKMSSAALEMDMKAYFSKFGDVVDSKVLTTGGLTREKCSILFYLFPGRRGRASDSFHDSLLPGKKGEITSLKSHALATSLKNRLNLPSSKQLKFLSVEYLLLLPKRNSQPISKALDTSKRHNSNLTQLNVVWTLVMPLSNSVRYLKLRKSLVNHILSARNS